MVLQASTHKNLQAWPSFLEKVHKHTVQPSALHVFQHNGKCLRNFPLGIPELTSLAVNRRGMHIELKQYAEDLGIKTQYSTHATEYMETDDAGIVVLSDGRELTADMVVAADGVGSRSWKLILHKFEKPVSSGYAIYRSDFPTGDAMKNPVIAEHFSGAETRMELHFGPNAHGVSITKCRIDTGNAKEDWWWTTSASDALPFVETWAPFFKEIVKFTPNNTCIDWELGRVVQIGDSAHTFLPSSGSGASMAMEDGFSLAAYLQIAGRQDIPLATRVHNKLSTKHNKFERVACAQKMGFKDRLKFHTSDLAKAEENPDSIGRFTGQWLLRHDPIQYAYDNFQACADHLLRGTEFKNSNFVPGHTFKQWTVTEFLEAQEHGKDIDDDGDWS
ncbi:hypothetical protein PSV09DRAFT_2376255 [Bipolaris maydis]|nr:hypothetical protein PSV09DRAFT_2376255 [Bipolaris maydis]